MQDDLMEQPDEVEIELGKLFRTLARRWKTIVLSALLGAGLAVYVTACLIPPRYESGVMFYVCSDSGQRLSSEDLSTARKLVESCMVLLDTRETQQGILDYTGMEFSCEDLEERITAEAMGDTELFQVTVTGENPVEAERIADAIGEILPGRVSALIDGFSVKVADAAILPGKAVESGGLRSALTGGGLGLLLSVSVISFRTLRDSFQKQKPGNNKNSGA